MTTIVAPPWEEQPTVGDIVAASALPLPDVWAPLSDSLRMITGYGREVKVGEDVVARMVNFSRSTTATYIGKDGQLKTAAVNEPRFEKEGLLIEGQSTNMVVQSEILPRMLEAGAYTITQSVVRGYNLHSCVYTAGDDALIVDTGATLQAADGTASFVFNSATIVSNWSCYFNPTDSYVDFWPKNSSVFEYKDLGNGLIRASRKLKGTTTNIIHLRCGKVPGSRIDIGCYQIEALPFASSYIPTNGAAATRAADIMTGLGPGNVPVNAPFSLAAEISVTPMVGVYPVLISMGEGLKVEMAEPVAGSQRIIPFLNLSASVPWLEGNDLFGGSKVLAIACDSSGMLIRYGGKTRAGAGGYIESIGDIDVSYLGVCHIRNFRIWHRALTDEQIKGVA